METTPDPLKPTPADLWKRLELALREIAASDRAWCDTWLYGATLAVEGFARAKRREMAQEAKIQNRSALR
jgi:hypothetical protein